VSAVYLYDDACARTFEPFALTRPAGEMRAGALLVRDRWSRALGAPVAGHLTAPHLTGFEEPDAAPVMTSGVVRAGSWIANARYLPALTRRPVEDALLTDHGVVAVRIRSDVPVSSFLDGTRELASLMPADGVQRVEDGWWAHEVWDYVRHLVPMLMQDLPMLGTSLSTELPAHATRIGTHPVFVEDGAVIEPAVCFDTTGGPKGHDGFVGHSILGRWVNLGAGTITSNLKNTYGTVQLWTPDGVRETGLQFLGTLFGDHAKTGIGLRLTTGTVLGAGANVYGSEMPPKAVAPFAWGEANAFSDYRVDKFLEVAERMMARRHVTLSDSMRRQLRTAFDTRWSVDS
jgi:hypothetical protein